LSDLDIAILILYAVFAVLAVSMCVIAKQHGEIIDEIQQDIERALNGKEPR
jgi:hypothetical protein